MGPLRISANGRFIVEAESGDEFFYLGDTGWEMLHRLSRESTHEYLAARAASGFNIVHTSILPEHEFERGNFYGFLPLEGNDPARPVKEYFEHVEWAARCANSLGIRLGLLPTWGDKWNKKWGEGPEIFTPENARGYGEYLGRRLQGTEVVWVLGGDREIQTDHHAAIIRATAEGIRAGEGVGRHLLTLHPEGQMSSAQFFHDDDWLSFNMWQTGHDRNLANYTSIAGDYLRTPAKPVLDCESGYEDHIAGYVPAKGRLIDYDMRKAAYWAVFAGACGHVYGCDSMWQFLGEPWKPVYEPRIPWRDALKLPGALQMRHVKNLIAARNPMLRVPDQNLLACDARLGTEHIQAMRASDGSYAYVYTAAGLPFAVDSTLLGTGTFRSLWYDPRVGAYGSPSPMKRQPIHEFEPPSSGPGNDWVLVIERTDTQVKKW